MAFKVYLRGAAAAILVDADDYEHVWFETPDGQRRGHGFDFFKVDQRVPAAHFSMDEVVGIVKK